VLKKVGLALRAGLGFTGIRLQSEVRLGEPPPPSAGFLDTR
jgi:hypothetical protein